MHIVSIELSDVQEISFFSKYNIIIIQTEDTDIVKRLLSSKMDVWKMKRDLKLEAEAKAKAERIRQWVFHCTSLCTPAVITKINHCGK